jgi:hypothetical protein
MHDNAKGPQQMRTRHRAALVAALTVATAVFAATALAANTATVGISVAGTSTTIHVSVPQTTDPIAAINFFVPAGYTANFSAASGATIGNVDATANGHDVGLTLPLSGPVTVTSPTTVAGDVCSPGTHAAIWNLNLSVAGQTLVLPVYLDPTSGAATALGAYQMRICLPPWDTPVGSPGRAFEGAQLLDAKFTVANIFTAPSAGRVSVWHNLFTPYVPGKGTPNAAGTFEAQSLVGTPSLSLKVKKTKSGYAAAGKLAQGGQAVSNATVVLLRGSSSARLITAGTTKTGTSGAWAKAGKVVGKKLTYFKATSSAGETAAPACVQPLPAAFAPGGCAGATVGAFSVSSPVAKFKP